MCVCRRRGDCALEGIGAVKTLRQCEKNCGSCAGKNQCERIVKVKTGSFGFVHDLYHDKKSSRR